MAKETGLGWTTLTVEDSGGTTARDIKNDVNSLSWSTPRGVQDTTGVDKSAYERLLLLADASLTLNGTFNDATNVSHDVFKTVSSTSVARDTILNVSNQQLPLNLLYTDYALTRASSGELTWTTTGVLADGTAPTWVVV
jgi:hypothetical protein